jgi:hypothetical protein
MHQLLIHRVQDDRPLSSRQRPQVILSIRRVFDAVWQSLVSHSSIVGFSAPGA